MKVTNFIISCFLILLGLTKSFAQIDYDLNLSNCIVNDTLYITVTVDNNGDPLTFANANFAFDIYNGGAIGDTTGLLFSDKFIDLEGPWSAAGGNAPDYREMSLGSDIPNFPFFNLSINVNDTTGNSGFTIGTGITDTIGVIGVPLTDSWCGDTIDFVWRDVIATTWPGHPFQKGDIIEWNSPAFPSIYADANFINPSSFILCEGCGGAALSYNINPVNPDVCPGDTVDFYLTPTPNLGDTVSFYVNNTLVQQTQDTLYRGVFAINSQVNAIVGDPSCLACGVESDTTNVTLLNPIVFDLLITPFGCDSLQLEASAGYTNYEVFLNGNQIYDGPNNSGNIISSGIDTIVVIATGGLLGGFCPDSVYFDSIFVSPPGSGIAVDLGIDTIALCFGEVINLNSGFVHDGININVNWETAAGVALGSGSSFNFNFVSPPPPPGRQINVFVDSVGCVGMDSVILINNYVNAVINPFDTTYCDVDTLKLFAGNHPAAATTTWLFNGGSPAVSDSIEVSSVSNGGDGPGTYSLIVENTILGKSCSDTVNRDISEIVCNVNANFTLLNDTFCIFSTNNIISGNTSIGDTAWLWNFGSGAVPSTSTDSLPTGITYTTGGLKTITLVVYGGGMTDTIQRDIFIEGAMTPPTVSTLLNSSDSLVFNWNAVTGADGYDVFVSINNSPFVQEVQNIDSLTHYVLVSSLDTVCIKVAYYNSCYSDTVLYCDQAFASNCPITFSPLSPVSECINGDSVCFELANITLPGVGFNGIIDPNNFAINWNGNILNNDTFFCYNPTIIGNQTVDFIIYSTDPGANCYVEGQLNVLIKDSLADFGLQVEPTFVSSTQVSFGWNSVPGALGYNYEAFINGTSITPPLGVDILDTFVTFTAPTVNVGDSVQVLVYAFNDCDTIYDPDDTTVTVIAIDTCFIGKIKQPSFIQDACAFDCYDIGVNVTYPPLSDYTIEWISPGIIAQGPGKDNDVTYCPPLPNVTDQVIFEIVDTAYFAANGTLCSVRDTIDVQVNPTDIPNWDLKTEFCITSFPYQIDADASPLTGWFYMVGDTAGTAVVQENGGWFFYPERAGVGTHTLVFKVCGDSLVRTVNVGDIPCVTTIFNDVGSRPDGIWTTCDGMIYYSDAGKHSIWSIDTNGLRTKILGDTTQAFRDFLGTCPPPSSLDRFRDGHRSFAKTISPRGLVVIEGTKDIYFADSYNHKIRKYVAATQEIITVAGPKTSAVSSDIPVGNSSGAVADSLARFDYPWGMTMDCNEDYIYFTDVKNQKMRRLQISEGGTFTAPFFVENVVGNAGLDINATTTGLNGRIGLPFSAPDICGQQVPVFGSHITMDGDDIYIPDPARSMLYKYNVTSDIVEPFVTPQFIPAYADGTLSFVGTGRTRSPVGSAIIPGADSIFFSDNQNFAIRSGERIDDLSSDLLTISGSPPPANVQGDDDGSLLTARYGSPTAMRFSSSDGFLYICDAFGTPSVGSIRRLALAPELTDPFFGIDTLFCLGDPLDTLISTYKGGYFTVIQGDTSVLTRLALSDTFFFNPIVADTFIIEYTALIGCCPRSWQKEFIVNGPPPVLIDSIIFSCDPLGTEIVPDSLNPNWTYSWLDSNNVEISINDSLLGTDVVGGIGEGTYYLTIFDTITGCSNMDSVLVQIGFSDTLRITGTNTMCFGDSVMLSIDTTAFQNWWWNTGDSTSDIFASGSGDYIAFATVGSCLTSDTFRVVANPLPNICINASIDTTLGRWNVGTLAGDITLGGGANVDGTAYNARFNQPWDVLYADGFIYVTDAGNNSIRQIDLSDTSVVTYAGTTPGITIDGSPRLTSQFAGPRGITYDKNTNAFYFISVTSNALLKIQNDSVFVVAGLNNLGGGSYAEGGITPLTASFNDPKDIDIDLFGNVYIAGYTEQVIRKFDPVNNTLFDVAGLANSALITDGIGSAARFNWPWGIGITKQGGFVIPTESHNIRQMDLDYNVTTLSGPGTLTAGNIDGDGTTSRFNNPWNVYVCPQGNSYITDGNNASVRVVDQAGNTQTIAGSTPWGYQDGDQDVAKFWVPTGITANSANGVMYVADRANNLIRTIVKNKTITICEGLPDTLNASCSLQGNEIDFYWVNAIGDTIRNATVLADTSGVFTFHVVDVNGCNAFDSVVVNQIPSIIPNINSMTAGTLDSVFGCEGDTIILDADSVGIVSYSWTSTSAFNGLATDSIISTDTSGRFIIEVVNVAGCSSFDTVDVIITPLPQISFTDSNLCYGETYTIDMSAAGFDSVIWNSTVDTNILIVDSTNQYIYEGYLNGCISTDTINVFITDSLVINLGNDTTICASDSVIFAPDSSVFASYQWTLNGNIYSTDSAIVTDSAGTYVLFATDSNGCTTSDTVVLNVIPAPIFSLPDTSLCFGETFTFDLTTVLADSIIWNDGTDTNTITVDSSGIYYATAYAGSCSYSDTAIVYIADSIFVEISGGGDTVFACLGDSALLEATPFGFGSYLWSPGGETDSAIYAYNGGTYIVNVSDSAAPQCMISDTVEVVFVPAPVLGFNGDTVYICGGDSAYFSPSLGNLPAGVDTILFSNGDTILNANDSAVISTSGWYYVTAILGSCGDYDSVFISILNPIVLTPDIPSVNCGIDSLPIGGTPTASGGSGQGFIYNWHSHAVDTAWFDDSTIANPIIIFDTSGTFTFTLTVSDSANPNCFVDTTFTFYTGLLPDEVADLGPDTLAVCGDDTVCFDFTQYNFSSVTWILENHLGQIQNVVNGDSICIEQGTISTVDYTNLRLVVVQTVGGGCPAFTDVDDITIFFSAPIIIDAGVRDTSICPADLISLGGSPTASGGSEVLTPNPFTYSWSVNTGVTPNSVANPSVNPVDSSFYILTVTDTVANCTVSDSVNVDVFIVPTVQVGNDVTICAGDTTTLTGIVTPFDNSLIVTWTPNSGTLLDSTILVTDAFPLDTTTYYFTVTDTIGCAALSDSVIVNVNTNPIADFTSDTVCADSSTTLISSTIGVLTWTTNGQSFNGSVINVPYGTGGLYNVELIADNGGCSDTVIRQVLVDTIPNVFAGIDSSLCITNDTVNLNNAIGNGNVTWSSTNANGIFNTSNIINTVYITDTTGTDSLSLFVIDGNGCRNSDQVILTFVPSPIADAGVYTAGCSGTGIQLSQATGIGSFSWSTNGDGTFDSTTQINTSYLFGDDDLLNGGATLTLTASSSPCTVVSSSATIGINPSAEAVITASVSGGGVVVDTLVEIFVDEGVTFDFLQSINYTLDSTGWDIDGNGTIDDLNSSFFQLFSEAGSSYLYLYTSNEFGCFDWDTIRIDVIGNQVVFIPNVFNPEDANPDNNVLKVFGTNVLDNEVFDFKLYNKWGELIFDETSFTIMNTTGWDGINEFTSEEMPLGVYTYTVKGEFRDGQTFEKVGNVTLIR